MTRKLWTILAAAALALPACGTSRQVHQAALDQGRALEAREARLQAENQAKRAQLTERRRELARIAERAALGQAELEQELAEIEAAESARAERLAGLRRFVAGARRAMARHDIDLRIRHGRMMLSLPDAVLFSSGTAELLPRGRAVLDDLAMVIKESSPRGFRITGHTDAVPIRTRRFDSNWELSTARAIAVVRYLTDQGLDATRLAATGRADSEPIASNATPEGRARNRRVEVVLEPDLSELPDLSAALRPAP